MMRKLLVALLFLFAMFTLQGCGGKKEEEGEKKDGEAAAEGDKKEGEENKDGEKKKDDATTKLLEQESVASKPKEADKASKKAADKDGATTALLQDSDELSGSDDESHEEHVEARAEKKVRKMPRAAHMREALELKLKHVKTKTHASASTKSADGE